MLWVDVDDNTVYEERICELKKITKIVQKYISEKKIKIFDPKNRTIVLCQVLKEDTYKKKYFNFLNNEIK